MSELKDSFQEAELRTLTATISDRLRDLGVTNIDTLQNKLFYVRHGIQFAITFDIWNEKTGKPEKL